MSSLVLSDTTKLRANDLIRCVENKVDIYKKNKGLLRWDNADAQRL